MDSEMSKDERKRLEILQKDGPKGVNGFNLKTLTYPDLQLLLCADPTIQDLIRQIVQPLFSANQNEAVESAEPGLYKASDTLPAGHEHRRLIAPAPPPPPPIIKYEKVIEKVPYEVRVEVPVYDPLRGELTPELKLLKLVQDDPEWNSVWLWAEESEGRQLVRLLALLSDWDEVLSLWKRLADRCKKDQRSANQAERSLLQSVLDIHNLRYRDRAARLVMAEIGIPFHHETMERGSVKGITVAEVWLPGLENAAGQVQKKPVVKTT